MYAVYIHLLSRGLYSHWYIDICAFMTAKHLKAHSHLWLFTNLEKE